MEKVAVARRKEGRPPLVLIMNSAHFVRDDHDGQDLLEMFQQRAEQWAASGLVTTSKFISLNHETPTLACNINKSKVFNSDEYWVYERLKRYATRMEVIPITDLPKEKAITALKSFRHHYCNEELPQKTLEAVYDKVGGRLSYLNWAAKSDDVMSICDYICRSEKTWFLNKCWILGREMDDDVMDEQKYSVSPFHHT